MGYLNGKQILLFGLQGEKGEDGKDGTPVESNPSTLSNEKLERITIDNETYAVGKKYKNFINVYRPELGLYLSSDVGDDEPIHILASASTKKKSKNIRMHPFKNNSLKYCNCLSNRFISKALYGDNNFISYEDIIRKAFNIDSSFAISKEQSMDNSNVFKQPNIYAGAAENAPKPILYKCNVSKDTVVRPSDCLTIQKYDDRRRTWSYPNVPLSEIKYAKYILKFVRGYEEVSDSVIKYWKGNMANLWLEVIVGRIIGQEQPMNTVYFLIRAHRF